MMTSHYLHLYAVRALCFVMVVWGFSQTGLLAETAGHANSEAVLRVPADYPTIQAAIDAAAEGDKVLIAPGTYTENLVIAGKGIKLMSEFDGSSNPEVIGKTVLSGAIKEDEENEGRAEQVLLVEEDAHENTEIFGLTIEGGDDGIACYANIAIRHCRFVNNVDAIDYEGGGGVCENCVFERNEDDAIDLDGACEIVIQNNQIVDNLDDGIEIRLQPYEDEPIEIVIRRNVIARNAEDGIQVIDYPGVSKRSIKISRNLIARNLMAGIGFMGDATTREDYRAAAIPEQIEILKNSLVDNTYGLTVNGNVQVRGNTFAQHDRAAIKTSKAQSALLARNLFWGNGEVIEQSSTGDESQPNVAAGRTDVANN